MLTYLSKINENAVEICRILQNNGYATYIVGGCVRDLLLGIEPKDWDICTGAKPEIVQNLFDKTYPTGLQHGTVTVSLNEEHFEVTTFRVEGSYLDGRRPNSVEFVADVKDDLSRRDLTINAMAFDPINKELIDPYGGESDLKNEIIRCVGNPLNRFNEDGLRIMRVARFASRFSYKVEEETKEAMKNAISTLKKVSIERIKDELWKTLQTQRPSIGLKLLRECHVLSMIEPEWDNFRIKEAIEDVDLIYNADVETKFAVLCSWFSVHTIEKLCMQLKTSNAEMKKIQFLISTLDAFAQFMLNMNPHTARIFLSHIRNNAPEHHTHSMQEFLLFSDAIGLDARSDLEKYQGQIVWARSDLKINGNDLIEMGVAPGPNIKNLLHRAYDIILKFPEQNERHLLLNEVRKIWNKTLS